MSLEVSVRLNGNLSRYALGYVAAAAKVCAGFGPSGRQNSRQATAPGAPAPVVLTRFPVIL